MGGLRRVCVFCGSATPRSPACTAAAGALGRGLAERGVEVVYGGASVGLMGVVADAALGAGGRVYGVIPARLVEREIAHPGLTELFVVDGMHPRKSLMANLADAFVALPGGFGTLEELFEMLTCNQIGHHRKPVVLLNEAGYYDRLVAFLDHAVAEGLVRDEHRAFLTVAPSVGAVLVALGLAPPRS